VWSRTFEFFKQAANESRKGSCFQKWQYDRLDEIVDGKMPDTGAGDIHSREGF